MDLIQAFKEELESMKKQRDNLTQVLEDHRKSIKILTLRHLVINVIIEHLERRIGGEED